MLPLFATAADALPPPAVAVTCRHNHAAIAVYDAYAAFADARCAMLIYYFFSPLTLRHFATPLPITRHAAEISLSPASIISTYDSDNASRTARYTRYAAAPPYYYYYMLIYTLLFSYAYFRHMLQHCRRVAATFSPHAYFAADYCLRHTLRYFSLFATMMLSPLLLRAAAVCRHALRHYFAPFMSLRFFAAFAIVATMPYAVKCYYIALFAAMPFFIPHVGLP